MSRKSGSMAFASRTMFDAFSDGNSLDEDDVEEQSQAGSSKTPSPTSPKRLSKSAKRRQAKQAATPSSPQTPGLPQPNGSTPVTNGTSSVRLPPAPSTPSTVLETGSAKPQPSTTLETSTSSQIPGIPIHPEIGTPSGSDSRTATTIASEKLPSRRYDKNASNGEDLKPSTSGVPTSDFSPKLPASLPVPSGDPLPDNRKRKIPQDFVPVGPGDAKIPSSPSNNAVKFENGTVPGEEKQDQRTMTLKPSVLAPKIKDRNAIERTIWTFIMIGGFITLLCLGHPYMILLIMVCQTLVYKEVTALFELRDQGSPKAETHPEDRDKWSKTLNWYFFVVTNYFLYGESIIYYFKHIVFVDRHFIPFARNHRFISFMLYMVGFMGFVGNLQRQYLRQQFGLFCWVHITLLLIVVSSHFIVNNILEGHVWFFIPASLVICNDVMAYVCGKLFGRTPLIKLSPKKTVEGFVGAFICTLMFGLAWGTYFMRFPYMICPATDLGTNVFSQVSCKPNPVFLWREFELTGVAQQILQTVLGRPPPAIPYAPFQIHVLVMATFASLVAPFGGFFASGFKRAFNIKDFGHSIPGHGGMTDRMDCQFLMGLFSYVYYSSLIRIQNVTVGSIMQSVVTSLTAAEQVDLFFDLKRFLEGQGIRTK
ncbi:hypothetical protein TREMEDRAFT_46158 [Tremella mesenterica DSM 1558]|uniref:uncharacterized protein n=1 Tax=Tremella mesenterica (strain ATCC 24925 / CBS 8224 / DSM 1558 / NBRC 9311 / NRRL Y-6157 / RJB 2259-6 / UBC 559-6) TaxID=578456 RepID=UPI00032BAB59|nr:uncharacterized protein TREMEDRAFT_46158 [Tremella mesenterica DSM 1558]EIW65473.1 hypothetical protein TREMEDRAFT_46158 [Tremella mesenterica DSM 1558]